MAESGEAPIAPVTPDGRYIVVHGRLSRRADPALSDERRATLVAELMRARRAIAAALRSGNGAAITEARALVHATKVVLDERVPVWWTDDAPDQNRRMARNTCYADWFDALGDQTTGG